VLQQELRVLVVQVVRGDDERRVETTGDERLEVGVDRGVGPEAFLELHRSFRRRVAQGDDRRTLTGLVRVGRQPSTQSESDDTDTKIRHEGFLRERALMRATARSWLASHT